MDVVVLDELKSFRQQYFLDLSEQPILSCKVLRWTAETMLLLLLRAGANLIKKFRAGLLIHYEIDHNKFMLQQITLVNIHWMFYVRFRPVIVIYVEICIFETA